MRKVRHRGAPKPCYHTSYCPGNRERNNKQTGGGRRREMHICGEAEKETAKTVFIAVLPCVLRLPSPHPRTPSRAFLSSILRYSSPRPLTLRSRSASSNVPSTPPPHNTEACYILAAATVSCVAPFDASRHPLTCVSFSPPEPEGDHRSPITPPHRTYAVPTSRSTFRPQAKRTSRGPFTRPLFRPGIDPTSYRIGKKYVWQFLLRPLGSVEGALTGRMMKQRNQLYLCGLT